MKKPFLRRVATDLEILLPHSFVTVIFLYISNLICFGIIVCFPIGASVVLFLLVLFVFFV